MAARLLRPRRGWVGVLVLLLAIAAFPASACSIAGSGEFRISPDDALPVGRLPATIVEEADLFIFGPASGSCEGVAMFTVKLRVAGSGDAPSRDLGYLIRPLAGVGYPEQFPPYPLRAFRTGKSQRTIMIGWGGVSGDADGRVHWRLALVPVNRYGQEGEPVPFCVSLDDWCSTPAARAPIEPPSRTNASDPASCLPIAEVEALRQRGDNGSREAAARLRRYYADCLGDAHLALQWARDAADLGDREAAKFALEAMMASGKQDVLRDARSLAVDWKLLEWFEARFPADAAK